MARIKWITSALTSRNRRRRRTRAGFACSTDVNTQTRRRAPVVWAHLRSAAAATAESRRLRGRAHASLTIIRRCCCPHAVWKSQRRTHAYIFRDSTQPENPSAEPNHFHPQFRTLAATSVRYSRARVNFARVHKLLCGTNKVAH